MYGQNSIPPHGQAALLEISSSYIFCLNFQAFASFQPGRASLLNLTALVMFMDKKLNLQNLICDDMRRMEKLIH